MNPPTVHKFGGTSVLDADRITNAASLIRRAADADPDTPQAAVSSALGGVTNRILAACDAAASGDRPAADAIVKELCERHTKTLDDLRAKAEAAGTPHAERDTGPAVRALLDELAELLHGTALIRDLTDRTRDRIVVIGEKIAVRFLAMALRTLGTDAQALDADTFMRVTGRFGAAEPLSYTDCPGVPEALSPLLEAGTIPVVTGFCGMAPDGATATLGRGGSDLSATLIGAALRAKRVVIWTDVAGVYSTDPRVVPEARRIDHLTVREASEMSYYGAKVLHPRTMIPVARLDIPVSIKSSLEPDLPGTTVTAAPRPGETAGQPVKAVTAVRDQAIVELRGSGMVGVPGVAGRVFTALAEAGINVTMISQSSSEASVCLAANAAQAERARAVIRQAFAPDIAKQLVEDVTARPDTGLIAVVGLGMAHTPGVAARVFTALAEAGVNVLAIAQGSSELNITFAVASGDIDTAVRAVHKACIA